MAINVTIDGTLYEGVEVITVGGKVLSLAYVENATGGGNTGGDNTGSGDNTGGNVPSGDALPTNGLLSYFDLRNLGDKANVTIGTTKGVTATQGNGALFSWTGSPITSSDEYGAVLPRLLLYSKDGSTNQTDLGTEYSVCLMVHGGFPALVATNGSMHTNNSNVGFGGMTPKYKTSTGEAAVPQVAINSAGDKSTYIPCAMTVSGNVLKMYFYGELVGTFTGTDYEDFQSWASTTGCGTVYSSGHTTAYAVYNRALTDTEVVEATAFMKTLEVVS